MATKQVFDGKTIIIPGVGSVIKSGIKNQPLNLGYGSVLIIDTGSGASFGGGAGFAGELASGKDETFYSFDNINDFRKFTHGGLWWLLADPLFKPGGAAVNGVSDITFIKAAETTAAEIAVSLDGDNDSSDSVSGTNGGTFTIQVKTEGLIGNGVLTTGSNLKYGYAFKMEEGKNDSSKFIFSFYRGTFKGLDSNSLPYDGITEELAIPELLVQSKEVSTLTELVTWMTDDFTFNVYFKLKESSVTGDGSIGTVDLDTYSAGYNLASGGTENYTADVLSDVLESINDLYVQFVLCDKYGSSAQHQYNSDILSWSAINSKYKPEIYIGAQDTIAGFATSKVNSAFFDSDICTVVHGGIKKSIRTGSGFKNYPSIYKAAALLGREAGLAPQVPLTFKNIAIEGEQHSLTDKEVEQALEAGLLVTRLYDGEFECVKGVNTLQENDFIFNEDGTTHSKQAKRIARQLNNELVINARRQLLKQTNGVNKNTLSAARLKSWTEAFLKTKIATPQNDNLIISYSNVIVTRVSDSWNVSYEFGVNGEVSFIFFTGTVIDF